MVYNRSMEIEYRIGDMLKLAPIENTVLVHACNARGTWGSGIARQFHLKYPQAFKQYAAKCRNTFRGDAFIVTEKGAKIGCLITSDGYAREVDAPEDIVENTRQALKRFLDSLPPEITEIHSPKINAGLFHTPWHLTEAVIKEAIQGKPLKWVVWVLPTE